MTEPLSPSLPPALAGVPGLDTTFEAVRELHTQHAQLQDRIIAAEDEYIRKIAEAHQAGKVNWIGLVAAYDQVRAWSEINGVGTIVDRWEAHIPHGRNTLARHARSMPTSPDGTSWTGNTGWEGLDTTAYPQRGMYVAFVLFGNGKVPVHIGHSEYFRNRLAALTRAGLVWESWFAQLCDNHQDAVEVKRELTQLYGEPNVAAQPTLRRDVALAPLADNPLPLGEPDAFSIDFHDEEIIALLDKVIDQPDVRDLVRRLPWIEWAEVRGVSGRLNRAAANLVHAAICDAMTRADISIDQATEIALAVLREVKTDPVRCLVDAFGKDLPERLRALQHTPLAADE